MPECADRRAAMTTARSAKHRRGVARPSRIQAIEGKGAHPDAAVDADACAGQEGSAAFAVAEEVDEEFDALDEGKEGRWRVGAADQPWDADLAQLGNA